MKRQEVEDQDYYTEYIGSTMSGLMRAFGSRLKTPYDYEVRKSKNV